MKRFAFLLLALTVLLLGVLPCYAEANSESLANLEYGEETVDGEALESEAQEAVTSGIGYLLQFTPEEWKAVIDERIVPWVTLAVSAIVGIYVAISPILAKIKNTSGIFEEAGGRLDGAKERIEKAMKKTDEAGGTIQRVQGELLDKYDELKAEFDRVSLGYREMRTSLSNIERIVRIGFCNTEELVHKGFAREIEKVGETDAGREEDGEAS